MIMKNLNKYEYLTTLLKEELKSGKIKTGDRFYTDKELMAKYKLSYATVSRAMSTMVDEGYFERRRGIGTIVVESRKTPGMTGDIMTKTLYLNCPTRENYASDESCAWFVAEEIRRGVLNSYPGPVQIEPFHVIEEIMESGEDNLTILRSPPSDFIQKHDGVLPNCVVINHRRDFYMEHNCVTWEMLSGVYEAIGYLIQKLGHQRIGFIGGDIPEYFADRFAGYRIALEAFGIPYNEELCVRGLRGYRKDGENAMKKLLALKNPPTAVFADTDLKAMGAVEAAKQAGLKVPEDMSIVGFDDMSEAISFTPPLTTVKIPYYEIGKNAAEMLLERLRTEQDIPTKVVRSELKIRESCSINQENDKK